MNHGITMGPFREKEREHINHRLELYVNSK